MVGTRIGGRSKSRGWPSLGPSGWLGARRHLGSGWFAGDVCSTKVHEKSRARRIRGGSLGQFGSDRSHEAPWHCGLGYSRDDGQEANGIRESFMSDIRADASVACRTWSPQPAWAERSVMQRAVTATVSMARSKSWRVHRAPPQGGWSRSTGRSKWAKSGRRMD
jgi:hypothetical protein